MAEGVADDDVEDLATHPARFFFKVLFSFLSGFASRPWFEARFLFSAVAAKRLAAWYGLNGCRALISPVVRAARCRLGLGAAVTVVVVVERTTRRETR